jgi:LPS export ABC transporter protein LptC
MIGFVAMLFSCKNDIETINSFSSVDSLPMEMARDIEILYSDSGLIQASLKGPLMIRNDGDDSYIEFPDGFVVVFFDSIMQKQSEITAEYGISFEAKKILEARNNVVVLNLEKKEQLNTEHLVWDQNKHIIYSDVFVKITTPDNVLYGDSLVSDENFNNYTINNVSGEFLIETDTEEDEESQNEIN